jgi:hypothetical protein
MGRPPSCGYGLSVRNPLAARQGAAVLVILAAVLWWHRWVPALIVVAFVAWVLLHERLEDVRGEGLRRAWRRAWPPATLVLVVLIAGGTALYAASSQALEAKIMPLALNAFAGLMVIGGIWSQLSASRRRPLSPKARAGAARESAAPAPAA